MHWRQCERTGHAIVDVHDDDSGEKLSVMLPWEHRHHRIGWGGRPRIRWSTPDGDHEGLELSRGGAGIIAYDAEGRRHVLPAGSYEEVPYAPIEALTKAKKEYPPPKPGSRWISVGLEGNKHPVLIEPAGDKTWRIVGGAGGKLNHLRLKNVKSEEQHKREAKERAKQKRAEKKARDEKLTPEERKAEREEKKEKARQRRKQERKIVQTVRDKLGGVSEDLTNEELKGYPEKVKEKLQARHHRKQFREAMKRRKDVVRALAEQRVDQLEDQAAVEATIAEDADGWTETQDAARRELELIIQEDEERKARRKPPGRPTSSATETARRAADNAAAFLDTLDREELEKALEDAGGRGRPPFGAQLERMPSDELARRRAELMDDAAILADAAAGRQPAQDAERAQVEFQVIQDAMRRSGVDMDAEPEEIAAALKGEAAILLRQAQLAQVDEQRMEALEQQGPEGVKKAVKLQASKDLQRGLSEEISDAARKLGLRDRDKAPLREAEAAELMEVLADIDKLRELRDETDAMIKEAEPPAYDASRRAFDLDTSEPPAHIVESVEEQVLRDLAQRITGAADESRPAHVKAVADGHYAKMADIALSVSNTSYLDRSVVDAVGVGNASILLRHAMEADGHDPSAILDALSAHHVREQKRATIEALREAAAFVPNIEGGITDVDDIEHAHTQLDAAEADLDAAQRAIGAALGQMEATATLAQAFRSKKEDRLEIPLAGEGLQSHLTWLGSVGLNPGDYEIDSKGKQIIVPASSFEKLIHRDSKEVIAQREKAHAIKRGDHDEKGWIPQGMVSRSVDTWNHRDPKNPRYWEHVDTGAEDLAGSLRAHVGARLNNGERPIDIQRDLLSAQVAGSAPDPEEFTAAVKDLFPTLRQEDHEQIARNQEIRGARQQAQDAYERATSVEEREEALAQLGGLEKPQPVRHRSDLEMADHYAQIANEHAGDAAGLHGTSLRDKASEGQVREVLFRTLSERPAARAAFKAVGDLDNKDRRALQDYFHEQVGAADRTWQGEYDQHLKERVEALRKSGAAATAPTMGGLFGGGAQREADPLTVDNFHEQHPEAAKRLAAQYPREGRALFMKAMGDRPDDFAGESRIPDEAHQILAAHIARSPGRDAGRVAQAATEELALRKHLEAEGMSWEGYRSLQAVASLWGDGEGIDERAADAGYTREQVQKAAGQVSRLAMGAKDHIRDARVRPDDVTREYGAKMHDAEVEAFDHLRRRAGTPWAQFVDTHGDLGRAYQALQDQMRGEAIESFRKHWAAVTDQPLHTSTRGVRNWELHQQATSTPRAREALAEQRRAEIQRGRQRGAKGEIGAAGQKVGGRFQAGSALEAYRQAKAEKEANQQTQTGLFGGGGGGMFGAPKQRPGKTILTEAQEPRAFDKTKGERLGLGDRAEAELEALIGGPMGHQFDPTEPGEKPKKEGAYHAGHLFPGASMDGSRIDQQRINKMMTDPDMPGRMGWYAGTGAGKTSMSIGAFTELHTQGRSSHGLFLVPTAVQDQFGQAMQQFTEPGRYRWETGDAKNHDDRVSMLRNGDNHMRVLTHAAFARDQLRLIADHQGVAPEVALSELRKMSDHERAAVVREVHDKLGIPKHFTYVDEAHGLTTRKGEEESLQSIIIGAVSHPTNSPHAAFGTATPHKNDTTEVHSMARLIDPHRYSDRYRFLQNHGVGSVANPDAIRREMDHLTYTTRIPPETERIDVANPSISKDGRKAAGGPIKLGKAHREHVEAVTHAYERARGAHANGGVDIEAVRQLSPGRFEGVPKDQHEEIARELGPSLGIVKETAMRKAINQAPVDINDKLRAMMSVLEHDTGKGKQSLVFTDSLEEAKLVHAELERRGIAAGLYHGGMNTAERRAWKRRSEAGEHRVGVMTAAGEAGINAQEYETIHNYDVPQTAKSHQQRIGRAYRQGQKADVHVHDWSTDTGYEDNRRRALREKSKLGDVFETPLGPLDEHGFARDYHAALRAKHQSFDVEMPLAAK